MPDRPVVCVLGGRGGVTKTAVGDAIARRIARSGRRTVIGKPEAIRHDLSYDDRGRAFPSDLRYLLGHDAAAAPADIVPLILRPADGRLDAPPNHGLDRRVEVFAGGRSAGTMTLGAYHDRRAEFVRTALASVARLARPDVTPVLVGSGAAVELHLGGGSAALAVAAAVRGPVVLVADARAGGALASLAGTAALLPGTVRARLSGVVLTRAGDNHGPGLIPGVREAVEDLTGLPVLGVLSYPDMALPTDRPPPPGLPYDDEQVSGLSVEPLTRWMHHG